MKATCCPDCGRTGPSGDRAPCCTCVDGEHLVPGSVAVYYRTNAAIQRAALPNLVFGLDKDDYEFVTRIPNAPALEAVFRMMNVEDMNVHDASALPVSLKVRSMMVDDVVVDEDGDVWVCTVTGWEFASW